VLLVLDHVHILHVPVKRYLMMGDSVLRGDAVARTMMWVVALHIRVWGHTCVECIDFKSCIACFILWVGSNEFSTGMLTTNM